MGNNLERGTGELTAFVILLFICVIIITSFYLIFNIEYMLNKKISKYSELEKINLIINEIEKDFNIFTEDEFDSNFSNGVIFLQNKYSEYNIIVKDISSGFNINCLPQDLLFSKSFEKLIFNLNNGLDMYKQILEKNKYLNSKEKINICLSEVGYNNVSFYGWINTNFTNCNLFTLIEKRKDKFPILNSIPMNNIFFTHPEILKIFIYNQSFNIKNPEEKYEKLINAINSNNILNEDDLIEILEIKKDNIILDIIGTKTQFWEISFYTGRMSAIFIVAGFPKSEKSDKIEYYKIIERNVVYENKSFK